MLTDEERRTRRNESQRKWNEKNRAKVRAVNKRHRDAHTEQTQERQRRHRDARREYALAHPEQMAAYSKKWRQTHPEMTRAANQKRRARLRLVVNDFTLDEWLTIVTQQDGLCFYCGCEADLEQEHKVPISRGGGHTRDNIVGSCATCNRKKGTKAADEFKHADDRSAVVMQVRATRRAT